MNQLQKLLEQSRQSRRHFLKASALAGVALGSAPSILAQDAKKTFKIALIGCGGRGNDALRNHMEAVKYVNNKMGWNLESKVVATADWSAGGAKNAGKPYGLAEDKCFGGADGYRKLLDENPDIVLMATPPAFRPLHFEACIKAGKHVFFEKPVAVDPPGVRRVIEAGELAKTKGLVVVAGTQRRHENGYNQRVRELRDGAYGRIMGGRVSWCMGKIFSNSPINPKNPGDLCGGGRWQLWVEMSGDHICEQHVHNLDIANWFLDAHPVNAVGFGWRAQRVAGNMYDFFSVDLEYPNRVHIHSMCRQVGACWDWVGEDFTYEKSKPGDFKVQTPDPYAEIGYHGNGQVSEHAHLLYSLVKGKEMNEARNVATSTGTAIIAREAAYSGQKITWKEMFEDPAQKFYNLKLKPAPEDFETGNVVYPKEGEIRIMGKYEPA
jgi:myo-inositol 2-dehydrogenase / D-chiro-inositol 1-dehydrogenase